MVTRFGLFAAMVFALMVMLASASHAQQQLVTQNKFVGGLVGTATGTVTFTQVVNGKARISDGAKPLSFENFSFLTLKIDTLYYTNNDVGAMPTLVTNTLGGASFTRRPDVFLNTGSIKKIQDTIERTWVEQGFAFEIVQDVYPVAFRNSGQIVVKVKIVNHTGKSLTVSSQYLLDVLAGSNDDAFMLEQYGYEGNKIEKNYTSSPPTFYMGFEGDPSTLNLGTIGAGYTTDAFAPAPMGLTPCSGMVFGNDPVLVTYTFGAPAGSTSPIPFDDAVLMQWPTVEAKGNNGPDSVTEIFRTSYGTGESLSLCYSSIPAITVRPSHLTYDRANKRYSPNPFNVNEIIFNVQAGPLNNVSVTQSVDGLLRIVGNPTQQIASIPAGAVTSLTWTDSTVSDTGCKGIPGDFDLSFNITASGLLNPQWTCDSNYIVTVDCVDSAQPMPKIVTRVVDQCDSYDGSFCNAKCRVKIMYDTGIGSTGIAMFRTVSLQNMRVFPAGVTRGKDTINIGVIDSMQNGIAIIRITDSSGVTQDDTTTYCTILDTRTPLIQLRALRDPCACFALNISDSQAWDRGLDTIEIVSLTNAVIDQIPKPIHGLRQAIVSGHPVDSSAPSQVCIAAIDIAGHRMDTCFSFAATAGVNTSGVNASSLRIYPNPSPDIFTIRVGDAVPGIPAQAEVMDVLGRTVARFPIAGTATFDASALPAGTYTVRVGGMSQRIVKE